MQISFVISIMNFDELGAAFPENRKESDYPGSYLFSSDNEMNQVEVYRSIREEGAVDLFLFGNRCDYRRGVSVQFAFELIKDYLKVRVNKRREPDNGFNTPMGDGDVPME